MIYGATRPLKPLYDIIVQNRTASCYFTDFLVNISALQNADPLRQAVYIGCINWGSLITRLSTSLIEVK